MYDTMPRLTLLAADRAPLLTQAEWAIIADQLNLSPREVQIVQYTFDAEKELAIGDKLGISPHTVHTHLERLYRKLGVSSRVGLTAKIAFEVLRFAREGRLSCPPAARRAAA
jgi:DNA-binding CsgD family transcriptional regulator